MFASPFPNYELELKIKEIIREKGPVTLQEILEELGNREMEEAVKTVLLFCDGDIIRIGRENDYPKFGFLDHVPGNCPAKNYEEDHEFGEPKKELTGDFEYSMIARCKFCKKRR